MAPCNQPFRNSVLTALDVHRTCAENPWFEPLVTSMNAFATLSTHTSSARAIILWLRPRSIWAAMGLCVALGSAAAPPVLATEPGVIRPTDKTVHKATEKRSAQAKQEPKKVLPADLPPEPASDEQRSAAERVYYGEYQCEFKQTVYIKPSEQHPAYVDLRFAKSSYLMRPVHSSTGAIRLEDVKGQTLMVQIASKSMLLNVKAGNRLVDECVGDGHRAEALAARHRAAQEAEPPSLSNSISASTNPTP